jgi:hypothetical protein
MEINRTEEIEYREGTKEPKKKKTMSRNQAHHPNSRHVTEEPRKTKYLCMPTPKKPRKPT